MRGGDCSCSTDGRPFRTQHLESGGKPPHSEERRYNFLVAKKATTIYACVECGNQATKWIGRCPECKAWNSFAEEEAAASSGGTTSSIGIADIGADEAPRISTQIPALDRVLGGGLVFGAVTLVGGEPGVGKSTLLLQAAQQLASR